MKTLSLIILKGFILCATIIITTAESYAQGNGIIDSIKLIPSTPVDTSTIRVACAAQFSSGSCFITDTVVSISDSVITVWVYHPLGMLTYICHSSDTITIGSNFSAGNYTVIYHLTDSGVTIFDSDTLYFTIAQTQAVNEISIEDSIKFYPNPATDKLMIQLPVKNSSGEIQISELTGKIIYKSFYKSDLITVDLKPYAPTLYLIRITTMNGTSIVKKIMIE